MRFLFRFLDVPFLPDKKVSHVLVPMNAGGKITESLHMLGIIAVSSPYSPSLPEYLRYHPDMNCRHLGGNRFAVFKDAENLGPLLSLGAELVFIDPPPKPKYPFDAALNVLPLGEKLVCNPLTADKELLTHFAGREIISVRQGYSACSVSVLGRSLVLTGDDGVSAKLEKAGIGVIRVNSANIVLEGCGNGFIGGSSGLLGPETICFTGDTAGVLSVDELLSRGFRAVCLDNGPMTDVGGIVPIMQVA